MPAPTLPAETYALILKSLSAGDARQLSGISTILAFGATSRANHKLAQGAELWKPYLEARWRMGKTGRNWPDAYNEVKRRNSKDAVVTALIEDMAAATHGYLSFFQRFHVLAAEAPGEVLDVLSWIVERAERSIGDADSLDDSYLAEAHAATLCYQSLVEMGALGTWECSAADALPINICGLDFEERIEQLGAAILAFSAFGSADLVCKHSFYEAISDLLAQELEESPLVEVESGSAQDLRHLQAAIGTVHRTLSDGFGVVARDRGERAAHSREFLFAELPGWVDRATLVDASLVDATTRLPLERRAYYVLFALVARHLPKQFRFRCWPVMAGEADLAIAMGPDNVVFFYTHDADEGWLVPEADVTLEGINTASLIKPASWIEHFARGIVEAPIEPHTSARVADHHVRDGTLVAASIVLIGTLARASDAAIQARTPLKVPATKLRFMLAGICKPTASSPDWGELDTLGKLLLSKLESLEEIKALPAPPGMEDVSLDELRTIVADVEKSDCEPPKRRSRSPADLRVGQLLTGVDDTFCGVVVGRQLVEGELRYEIESAFLVDEDIDISPHRTTHSIGAAAVAEFYRPAGEFPSPRRAARFLTDVPARWGDVFSNVSIDTATRDDDGRLATAEGITFNLSARGRALYSDDVEGSKGD